MGKFYYKFIFIMYWVALIVCGAARVYLKLFNIDVQSGFYINATPIISIFNITLTAVIAIMIIMNRLRITDNEYPIIRGNQSNGILALLVGISLALFVLEDTGIMRIIPLEAKTLSGIALILCAVLGILAAVFFLIYGAKDFLCINKPTSSLLALFPALWQLVLVVAKFNTYATLTTISDNLLTVMFLVFAAVFMVGYARTLCGFARKDGRNYTIPTGLATSLIGILLVVPNYVFMVINSAPMPALKLGYMESLYILILSIFALSTVVRIRRTIAIV